LSDEFAEPGTPRFCALSALVVSHFGRMPPAGRRYQLQDAFFAATRGDAPRFAQLCLAVEAQVERRCR